MSSNNGGHIVEVRHLSKWFGDLQALDDVNLTIDPGQVLVIIGPSGSGKSTLLRCINYLETPTSGEIWFMGKKLETDQKLLNSVRANIGMVFQSFNLYAHLTVLENVMVGRHLLTRSGILSSAFRLPNFLREELDTRENAMKYLELVGLADQADEPAASLPFGRQRLVAIARALATEPKILLLDEPGAGLNATEKAGLAHLIGDISGMGITVLLVEHDMDLVMRTADWVVVLDFGKKIAEGTAAKVQQDKQVIAAYLGEELDYAQC